MNIKVMGLNEDGKLVELGSNDKKSKCVNDILNQIFKNDGKIEIDKAKNEAKNETKEEIDRLQEDNNAKVNNKKELVDYDREYNIYEVLTLLKNMPIGTEVECLKDERKFLLRKIEDCNAFVYDLIDAKTSYIPVAEVYYLSELLDLKFKLVKEEEIKPQDRWIGIDSLSELINLLQNNKVSKLKVNGEDVYLLDDNAIYKHSNFEAFTDLVMPRYDLGDLAYSSLEYIETI